MKYIKKLNIDFKNWDDINDDYYTDLFDKFLYQKMDKPINRAFYIGDIILRINHHIYDILKNYIKNNKLNIEIDNYEPKNDIFYIYLRINYDDDRLFMESYHKSYSGYKIINLV